MVRPALAPAPYRDHNAGELNAGGIGDRQH